MQKFAHIWSPCSQSCVCNLNIRQRVRVRTRMNPTCTLKLLLPSFPSFRGIMRKITFSQLSRVQGCSLDWEKKFEKEKKEKKIGGKKIVLDVKKMLLLVFCRLFCFPQNICTSGLLDFSWYIIPNPEKIPKWTQNLTNGHIKYPKCPSNIPNGHKIGISSISNLRPSKIYPNWDFWFEKKPSGNPDIHAYNLKCRMIFLTST
jgi:hypothetical protein